jgi:hypothetical protein
VVLVPVADIRPPVELKPAANLITTVGFMPGANVIAAVDLVPDEVQCLRYCSLAMACSVVLLEPTPVSNLLNQEGSRMSPCSSSRDLQDVLASLPLVMAEGDSQMRKLCNG